MNSQLNRVTEEPPSRCIRGEMESRIQAFNWSATPLGAPDTWTEVLCLTTRLVLLSPAPMLIWWGPDLIQIYNDAAAEIMGTARHPDALGQPGSACWAEIWNDVGAEVERAMAGGSASGQGRLMPVTRDGIRQDVWWDYSYSPIEDRGEVGGVLVIFNDVTARIKAEEHQRLLAGEMHHRMKNGLTVIQSLVTLTGRSVQTVDEYRNSLSTRIQALAATQDLFIQSEGEYVDIRDLLLTELAPSIDDDNRVKVVCPPITASHRSATGFSLIVHELFTNAIKYGAFSSSTGRLLVACSTSDLVVKMEWRESGCTGIVAGKRGFGTTLIERVANDLGGSAVLEFNPAGLVATIKFGLAHRTALPSGES